MATITKTQSGTWKTQVRKIGLPAVSKTFKTKHEAEVWSRSVAGSTQQGCGLCFQLDGYPCSLRCC